MSGTQWPHPPGWREQQSALKPCLTCRGEGEWAGLPCHVCGGRGRVPHNSAPVVETRSATSVRSGVLCSDGVLRQHPEPVEHAGVWRCGSQFGQTAADAIDRWARFVVRSPVGLAQAQAEQGARPDELQPCPDCAGRGVHRKPDAPCAEFCAECLGSGRVRDAVIVAHDVTAQRPRLDAVGEVLRGLVDWSTGKGQLYHSSRIRGGAGGWIAALGSAVAHGDSPGEAVTVCLANVRGRVAEERVRAAERAERCEDALRKLEGL